MYLIYYFNIAALEMYQTMLKNLSKSARGDYVDRMAT
jgi:hypothetical protein